MPIEKRLAINLTRRGAQALEGLTERTGESQTDLVNRALMLLDFVEGRTAVGDALVLLNPQGENTRVILL